MTSSSPSINHSPSRAEPPFSVATLPPMVRSSRPPPLPKNFSNTRARLSSLKTTPTFNHASTIPLSVSLRSTFSSCKTPAPSVRPVFPNPGCCRFQSISSKKASAISFASPMPACPAPHTGLASSTLRPKPRLAALSPSCRTAT